LISGEEGVEVRFVVDLVWGGLADDKLNDSKTELLVHEEDSVVVVLGFYNVEAGNLEFVGEQIKIADLVNEREGLTQ
jgi:hypothetical protein